ncbi:MAG: hypothetical protein Q8R01_00770, partial [Ramlibacter sp.]|nr:hypothetical protein [Ramlibacter sp.]
EVTLTFRFGKGAAFWGPFSVVARAPTELAQALADACAASRGGPLFSEREQRLVAAALKERGFPLRSIRRGSLTLLAASGVSDSTLQIRSAHRRRDTLMRYLGWGIGSSDARRAARECGVVTGGNAATRVGPNSGFVGNRGRRTKPPPPLIPNAPPSGKELGLEGDVDCSAWRLHVKHVGLVDWNAVGNMVRGTRWEQPIDVARRWCTSTEFYGENIGPIADHRVPYSRIPAADVRTLLQFGKIAPHEGPIDNYVFGFLLPQPAKQVRRPIFEPHNNKTSLREAMPPLAYPSRRERRAAMVGRPFSAEFDLAAYFDQLPLAENVRSQFVLRVRDPVDGCNTFVLTRLPMGATFAPSVAQTLTWAVVAPLLEMPGVAVHTMIDNVRIAAPDLATFTAAVDLFLARARQAGLTLNPREAVDPQRPLVFLGEQYVEGERIANAQRHVDKLRAAHRRFTEGDAIVTARQFAALVGLALFLAHTLGLGLAEHYGLLRAYRRIAERVGAGREGGINGWDLPLEFVAPTLAQNLTNIVATLVENRPVPLPTLRSPSYDNTAYDTVIVIDASESGWGAFVQRTREGLVLCLRQRWAAGIRHSATAEPRAVVRCVTWLLQNFEVRKLAVVTDHEAIARGQRRWHSFNGGFSPAYDLNEAYCTLYGDDRVAEVFIVAGELNPADGPSRDPGTATTVTATASTIVFPSLRSFAHPYPAINRPSGMV